jgi:hypothetical protein
MLRYRNWLWLTTITFNLFKAYISLVESPCTVDSTLSNLMLLPWLDIGIVSTLPRFLSMVLQVASTPRVLYLNGYHTLFDLFRVPPHIPTYDIRSLCYDHALSDLFQSLSGRLQPFRLRPTLQPLCPIQLSCCVRLVPLMHNPWGFRNEGLLSVPQIKHMTYATMLLSYCSYCLSPYLLSFTYFFLH